MNKKTRIICSCLLTMNCLLTACDNTEAAVGPATVDDTAMQMNTVEIPSARYFGNISIDNGLLIYDFQIKQKPSPVIEILFNSIIDNVRLQTLTYELSEDFNPETITDGLEILDVNGDEIDDFLIDLGIYGHMSYKICLVYDEKSEEYVFVREFEKLNSPRFIEGYIVTSPIPMEIPITYNRYLIRGAKLEHTGTLLIFQNEMQTLYTEYELINGEPNIVEEVEASEIDLSKWGIQ